MVMICDHSQVELLDYPNHRYFAVCAAAEEESADGGGTSDTEKGRQDGGVWTVDSGGGISPEGSVLWTGRRAVQEPRQSPGWSVISG